MAKWLQRVGRDGAAMRYYQSTMNMIKELSLLGMLVLASCPLMGQDAKKVADELTVPQLAPGATHLTLPKVPKDVTIEFGGADYEQIIGKNGTISPVLSDTPVLVYFRVTKDGQTVDSKDYEVVVKPAAPAADGANPKPATVPAILQWKGGKGEWKPGSEIRVHNAMGNAAAAKVFCKELRNMFPKATVSMVKDPKQADICLKTASDSRSSSAEGYTMKVAPKRVTIIGESAAGAFMGTRTLLQILASKGEVPCGEARDFPRYKVRGCMLDIARSPFCLADLRDLIDMMAWYKMNDLHLCINNNYIFHENYEDAGRDQFKESYSAFRLESDVKGKDGTPLTAQDLSYTKQEFRALIDYAKVRGVNIVPEFDTPGHALSFTRVRPDLIYQGRMPHHPKRRCEMLDAANPETLKFVNGVFDEYLLKNSKLGRPVFEGCVVHVGSDEFFGAAEDYRKYANGVLQHVLSRGYTPRIWGSLGAKRGKTPVVSKGVQMNIWSKDWMLPIEAVEQGYDIINTFDRDLYFVPFANYYRMDRNHRGLYNNWLPNRMGPQQIPAGHPRLLGATFAVWNDLSDIRHNGYGMIDIREAISGSLDVLCGKLWGEQKRAISFEQHRELVKAIGQSPASAGESAGWESSAAVNRSTAAHHPAMLPPYRLTMEEVKLAEETPGREQVLLSGPEGTLLGVMKDGGIGFRRADGKEFEWDAKLPVDEAVKLEIVATVGKTRLFINGKEVEKMTLNSCNSIDEGFNKRTRNIVSSFILPGDTLLKSFRGSVRSIKVQKGTGE